MKDALSRGVLGKRKQADTIEAVIWGVRNILDEQRRKPSKYRYLYCCKLFGLRGHDEHHSLECNTFFTC